MKICTRIKNLKAEMNKIIILLVVLISNRNFIRIFCKLFNNESNLSTNENSCQIEKFCHDEKLTNKSLTCRMFDKFSQLTFANCNRNSSIRKISVLIFYPNKHIILDNQFSFEKFLQHFPNLLLVQMSRIRGFEIYLNQISILNNLYLDNSYFEFYNDCR